MVIDEDFGSEKAIREAQAGNRGRGTSCRPIPAVRGQLSLSHEKSAAQLLVTKWLADRRKVRRRRHCRHGRNRRVAAAPGPSR